MGGVLLSGAIICKRVGGIAIVRFNKPEIRSPLSISVLAELESIIPSLTTDAALEKVIFTGVGNVFASGADLREIAMLSADDAAAFARRGQSLMASIAEMPQMTVAAVNGFCFGGALDLALSCDKRIAASTATFAHPGASLGIITGWGGTQRLTRLIGAARASEMFFTASPIDAVKALDIGLADEIAADVILRSREI